MCTRTAQGNFQPSLQRPQQHISTLLMRNHSGHEESWPFAGTPTQEGWQASETYKLLRERIWMQGDSRGVHDKAFCGFQRLCQRF